MKPGDRPPWWPPEEPFPPRHGDRRRMRGHFPRRIAIFFFIVLFVLIGLMAASIYAISALLGAEAPRLHPGAFVVALVLWIMAFGLLGRTFRRFGRPLGDLIEAAGRVEEGDYAVRVREQGPRELRALSRAFNSMSARLERSEAERRRLLADVTHELRTPLTVMQGNVEALVDGVHPVDPHHLNAILDETRVLSRLVDDLRTLSLAETGALALHREAVDSGAVAHDVVASFASQADGQGVRLALAAEAGLPTVNADPVRLKEVLVNVISNALRYTPRAGSVEVSVAHDPSGIAISVKDTGPGIAPEVLPHLFERFARSQGSTGAGLGLAIAKGIVAAHGGRIEATSQPGQGTEIRFTLPRGDGAATR